MGYDMTLHGEVDEADQKAAAEAKAAYMSLGKELGFNSPEADAAYEKWQAADRGYWRWNIWGMGIARSVLMGLGVMFDSEQAHEWPDHTAYGLTEDEAWGEDEDSLDVLKRLALVEYRAAHEAVLRDVEGPQRAGLPVHKFCSNDGWWVTEEECASAVEILDSLSDEALRRAVMLVSPDRSEEDVQAWLRSIRGFGEFLRYASTRQGFHVY